MTNSYYFGILAKYIEAFSSLSPPPPPLPLTHPISSSLREVSTWRFREQIARSKKTPALQATPTVDTVLRCPASVDQNSHWGEAHHAIVST